MIICGLTHILAILAKVGEHALATTAVLCKTRRSLLPTAKDCVGVAEYRPKRLCVNVIGQQVQYTEDFLRVPRVGGQKMDVWMCEEFDEGKLMKMVWKKDDI